MTAKLLQNRETFKVSNNFKQLNVAEQGVDKKISQDFLQQYPTQYIRFRAFSYRMLDMGK